jgi:flagellar hook-length control protein FliK
MNIQAANLLSMLSGSEGLGNIQQGLLSGAGDQGGFAAALMEQLGVLQNGGSPDMSALQSFMDDATANGGVQNFAGLFGKNLPAAANKSAQDIDLEDTLQTLADVMQQLQQLGAEAKTQQTPLIDSENQQALAVDLRQQALDDAAQANYGMPISVPAAVDKVMETVSDSPELSGMLTDAKKPAPFVAQDAKTQNTAGNVAGKPDELGAEFDRSISAMMAKEGADAKQQQDKTTPDMKVDPGLGQFEKVADSQDFKANAGIAGDIARMNSAVRNDAATLPANQPAMQKPLGDPAWRQELGDKLIWMHKQDMPSVQLRLNPEHLGPVLVKIDVHQDQTSVAFTTHNLAVKEAIEAAIPKLREMLGGQQLNLADVNVSQQQSEQRQSSREFFQMAGDQSQRRGADGELLGGAVNESQDIVDEIEAGRAIASNGLLSLFA